MSKTIANKTIMTLLLYIANIICPGLGFFILRKHRLALLQYGLFALIDLTFLVLLPLVTSSENILIASFYILTISWGIFHLIGLARIATLVSNDDYELIGYRKQWLSIFMAILVSLITQGITEQYKNLNGYRLPAGGMEPTLAQGQRFVVNSLAYKGSAPKRGDIIVFAYPEDISIFFVKRVAGLPGDTIDLIGKRLYVNGRLRNEPYAYYSSNPPPPIPPYKNYTNFSTIVAENEVFVLGDNRYGSFDSRIFGSVPFENIKGKAISTYTYIPPAYSILRHY